MEVPYFDLKAQYASLREDILAALDRVCRTASFVLGEDVARFEEEFAAYCGVKHCVGVNTGTSALHLALLAAGGRPGDEVITTPNTFIATAEAEIGRASCRERGEISGVAGSFKKKKINTA